MEKETSTPELEKVKLLSHEEIVKKVFVLKNQNGISFLEIAKGANISYSYLGQIISSDFPFVFKGKNQTKICTYLQRPEMQAIFSGKESLLTHGEIINRIEYLNKKKGIRYKQIAEDSKVAQYYFMQLISNKFPDFLFRAKTQIKMCKYFKRPEIKAMLKDFS